MNKPLSEFLTDLKLEQVPKAVVDKAKLALLDTIGVGLAGSASRAARISQEFVLTYPMMPATASIWGRKERTSILWAAFVNAAAAASLDADDGHRGACGHPGGVIIPAAMAACDRINASGKMLLESIIAGYEIGLRVGMVVNRLQEERFFGSGTWASFGAAAADAVTILEQIEGALAYLDSVGTRAEDENYKHMRLVLISAHRTLHNRMHIMGYYHDHTPVDDHPEHY